MNLYTITVELSSTGSLPCWRALGTETRALSSGHRLCPLPPPLSWTTGRPGTSVSDAGHCDWGWSPSYYEDLVQERVISMGELRKGNLGHSFSKPGLLTVNPLLRLSDCCPPDKAGFSPLPRTACSGSARPDAFAGKDIFYSNQSSEGWGQTRFAELEHFLTVLLCTFWSRTGWGFRCRKVTQREAFLTEQK